MGQTGRHSRTDSQGDRGDAVTMGQTGTVVQWGRQASKAWHCGMDKQTEPGTVGQTVRERQERQSQRREAGTVEQTGLVGQADRQRHTQWDSQAETDRQAEAGERRQGKGGMERRQGKGSTGKGCLVNCQRLKLNGLNGHFNGCNLTSHN